MTTPRKINKNICLLCKSESSSKSTSFRRIESESGKNKNLSNLIFKYIEVQYVEGLICRPCENKVFKIDKLVLELKENVKEQSLVGISEKRCLNTHILETENTPVLKKRGSKVKTGLFTSDQDSDVDQFNSTISQIQSDSGYLSTLTPILPKFNRSSVQYQSSPIFTSTPKPVSKSHQDQHNGSATVIPDHSYCSTSEQKPAGPQKKQPKSQKKENLPNNNLVNNLLKLQSEEVGDFLTNEECSSVLSILPLRSRQKLINCLLNFVDIKTLLQHILLADLSAEHHILKNRKRGELSVLMNKDSKDLKNFQWDEVVSEAVLSFPFLVQTILAFMVPSSAKQEKLSSLVPRIGLIYALLAQGRNIELSKVQRVISILLFDNLCDQKVFDRLQPLGICLSYNHGLTLLDKFSGNYNAPVIDALKAGKKIRIVGDNINWKTNVHDERQDHHGRMHHAFGSAVVVQNVKFDHLSDVKPQCSFRELQTHELLPSPEEWNQIRTEYAILMIHVAVRLIPYFKAFEGCVPKLMKGSDSEMLAEKSKVVPLPVLHLNEQKYDDVVQIMDFYESFLEECFDKAGIPIVNNTHVLVGGDQLTRERFSGAKRLRAASCEAKERFQHLSPITFELFHMLMNYVKLIFKHLYHDDSGQEVGTLKCEANRLLRTSLNPNVNDHYDADKDFILSFVDSYIIEAVLHYFDMEDVLSSPKQNVPDSLWQNEDHKKKWLIESFEKIVDEYVWNKEEKSSISMQSSVEEDGLVIPITLQNGRIRSFVIKKAKKTPPEDDRVKNYAHLSLELGLHFKAVLDLCKLPDRDRGLRLLKVCMIHFKASNNLSKYADEILRLLVHQYCTLSLREAHEEFYALFVNTKGHLDSHIPCDLQMEHIVKSVKKNIKHMFSNKTEKNITTRTSALPVMKEISENYDTKTGVMIRCKKHSDLDAGKDELDIIGDLRQLQPFRFHSGRQHQSFKSVNSKIASRLNVNVFHGWIKSQVYKHATELGN